MATIGQQGIGITTCLDKNTILNQYNGNILENQDGTVSVFYNGSSNEIVPMVLSKSCCEYIDPRYYFDIETQKCRWSTPATCNLQDVFKLVLNPKGNDGTLFYIEPGDTCYLTVDFNYLFKVKCETLSTILNSQTTQAVDPKFLETLTSLQTQLATQIILCEALTVQLTELMYAFNNTSYSVICNTTAAPTAVSGPVLIRTVGSTAFGTAIPFGFTDVLTIGQLYCINEPEGLNQWRLILGETNYANFIAGDQTAYTCGNLQTLFDMNLVIINNNIFNGTTTPELMVACDTPLNTKSDLMVTITNVTNEQVACAEQINVLNTQIKTLESLSGTSGNLPCSTPLSFFESFDVSISVDMVTSANTLESVYTAPLLPAIGNGNFYNYLATNKNSGFYVCGEPNCIPLIINLTGDTESNAFSCTDVRNSLVDSLFNEYGGVDTSIFINSIPSNAFSSNWLHYNTVITDPLIIKKIANQLIKVSFKINHTCGDFCVLVDEIELNKVCTNVKNNNIFLSKSPGFELDRVIDNKKSWVTNSTPTNRQFVISNNRGTNDIRQTNYDVNDERLVINSKEVDLDINLAGAIETDVLCFLNDNPCLLTGITTCLPCAVSDSASQFNHSNCCGDDKIDFQILMTQPLSAVTTIEDFEYFLTSELIDAKNRQTISGYPTLRALYDRYINSGLYCGNISSKFDYMTMEQFAGLVGTYWVDIVEQVIPATTIWGSTKIYSNTIFDQQKFKYRNYSTLFCGNPYSVQTLPSPINGTSGQTANVEVRTTTISQTSSSTRFRVPTVTICSTLCVAQMNSSNEFIGSVNIIGSTSASATSQIII